MAIEALFIVAVNTYLPPRLTGENHTIDESRFFTIFYKTKFHSINPGHVVRFVQDNSISKRIVGPESFCSCNGINTSSYLF